MCIVSLEPDGFWGDIPDQRCHQGEVEVRVVFFVLAHVRLEYGGALEKLQCLMPSGIDVLWSEIDSFMGSKEEAGLT